MLSTVILRIPAARQFSGQGPSRCCAAVVAPRPHRIAARYTSMQGRLGEEGEEETSLRASINKLTSEKQYAGTFRVGGSGSGASESSSANAPVNEEKEPGHHPSPTSAPESGTEGRTPGSGAGTESARTAGGGSSRYNPATPGGGDSEDVSSAPESGTVRG
ncbi:hypothetical protein VaNZ11_008335 [Volvox africanus]|uniref:Uncharacterized protein n=1 Tax=Volvox africanus TaxID=51714 RepID=A0ABQ5S572_9CHLO|nr:hypothetical protein VaNZ11_008335 [Volvox africanus]